MKRDNEAKRRWSLAGPTSPDGYDIPVHKFACRLCSGLRDVNADSVCFACWVRHCEVHDD